MNLSLAIKVGIATLITGGSVCAIVILTNNTTEQDKFNSLKENSTINTKTNTKTIDTTFENNQLAYLYAINHDQYSSTNTNIDFKNLQCQLEKGTVKQKPFDCDISALKDDDKKQHNIKKIEENLTKPNVKDLKEFGKVFQIKFDGKHWDTWDGGYDSYIEIISKKDHTTHPYARLQPVFAVYKSQKKFTSIAFIVKGANEEDIKIENSPNPSCSFESNTTKYSCRISSFTKGKSSHQDKNYSDLTFQLNDDDGEPTTIQKDQYFLIQFIQNPTEIKTELSKNVNISVKNHNQPQQTANFTNAIAVFDNHRYSHIFVI